MKEREGREVGEEENESGRKWKGLLWGERGGKAKYHRKASLFCQLNPTSHIVAPHPPVCDPRRPDSQGLGSLPILPAAHLSGVAPVP